MLLPYYILAQPHPCITLAHSPAEQKKLNVPSASAQRRPATIKSTLGSLSSAIDRDRGRLDPKWNPAENGHQRLHAPRSMTFRRHESISSLAFIDPLYIQWGDTRGNTRDALNHWNLCTTGGRRREGGREGRGPTTRSIFHFSLRDHLSCVRRSLITGRS